MASPVYALSSIDTVQNSCKDEKSQQEIEVLINKANIHDQEKYALKSVLMNHRKVFCIDGERLGTTKLVEHEIETGNAKPIAKSPFRTPIAHRKLLHEEVQKMLQENVIRPSKSSWAAPLFLVQKKDKSWRPVKDYRGLNVVTVNDVYPLPRI